MRHGVVASTVATAAAALALSVVTARWTALHWGATTGEVDETLPGDDVVRDAQLVATRAITIDAPPERVWPWVVQIGQDRAGFYSYDWLENLVGCDIHSADEVVEPWQHLEPGDPVRLHPQMALTVESIEPGRSMVLSGGPGGPGGPLGPDGPVGADEADRPSWVPSGGSAEFTWAFIVRKHPDLTTRLLVRERYAAPSGWSRLWLEPLSAVSSVMSQKMLRGIRDRAEASRVAAR